MSALQPHRPLGTRPDPVYVVRTAPPAPPGAWVYLLLGGLFGGGLLALGFAPVGGVVMIALGALVLGVRVWLRGLDAWEPRPEDVAMTDQDRAAVDAWRRKRDSV